MDWQGARNTLKGLKRIIFFYLNRVVCPKPEHKQTAWKKYLTVFILTTKAD